MEKGRVKWFNNKKGYGFIEYGDQLNKDVFVHYSQIECEGYKALTEGNIVTFKLIKTKKGYQAKNVKQVKLTSL